jgi:hypothetical protein
MEGHRMTNSITKSRHAVWSHFSAQSHRPANRIVRVLIIAVRLLIAAGLAIDAWVHVDLAPTYDIVTARISEGTLFRLEAVVAAATALLVLLLHRRITHVIAFGVSATAVAVLLLNTYAHPGQLGPFPDMYEPTWFAEKSLALAAEMTAAVAALAGLALETRNYRPRRARRTPAR